MMHYNLCSNLRLIGQFFHCLIIFHVSQCPIKSHRIVDIYPIYSIINYPFSYKWGNLFFFFESTLIPSYSPPLVTVYSVYYHHKIAIHIILYSYRYLNYPYIILKKKLIINISFIIQWNIVKFNLCFVSFELQVTWPSNWNASSAVRRVK